MRVLVTGAAGFIGHALTQRLLARGDCVVGVDNLNDYYATSLKMDRLKRLKSSENFSFLHADVSDRLAMNSLRSENFDVIVHLAAQAGVRNSIPNPEAYIDANLVGFGNVLELARRLCVAHLVFASSSSVYGANSTMPLSESDSADHPLSLYAATKRANELMAHSYANLFRIPCTGLRYFTVYGPWGRPDMALFKFTKAILDDAPFEVYNQGNMVRDFTYIDDIVEGTLRVLDSPAQPNPAWQSADPTPESSRAPYRIFNIGNNRPIQLLRYIEAIEKKLGRTGKKVFLPLQAGDVETTTANVTLLRNAVGFQPGIEVEAGVEKFVEWYRSYYGV